MRSWKRDRKRMRMRERSSKAETRRRNRREWKRRERIKARLLRLKLTEVIMFPKYESGARCEECGELTPESLMDGADCCEECAGGELAWDLAALAAEGRVAERDRFERLAAEV